MSLNIGYNLFDVFLPYNIITKKFPQYHSNNIAMKSTGHKKQTLNSAFLLTLNRTKSSHADSTLHHTIHSIINLGKIKITESLRKNMVILQETWLNAESDSTLVRSLLPLSVTTQNENWRPDRNSLEYSWNCVAVPWKWVSEDKYGISSDKIEGIFFKCDIYFCSARC